MPPDAPPALPLIGAVAGVAAAPLARESKLAAQRRWRTAAIIALREAGAPVQASSVLPEMDKLRTAEAVQRGVTLASMHPLQSAPNLRQCLIDNE